MPLVTHLISIMLLFCLQRDTHARANTHILRNTARSQAYSRLMVNAWNVSVPYQTASILAVDVISLARAVGTVFKICNENNPKKVTAQFFCFFYCLSKIHVSPLCSLKFISLWGMCSRKQNYFFNFPFRLPCVIFRRPLNCTCLDCKACAWNASIVGLWSSCAAS